MHRHENAFLSAKGDFRKLKLIRNGRKIAPRFPRCGIELGYLAFGNRISLAVKQYEDRNWSASMASTTLAMAPVYCFRFAGSHKTDSTAQTTAFELLGRIAHDLILLSWLEPLM
jgi:hypothetical protein